MIGLAAAHTSIILPVAQVDEGVWTGSSVQLETCEALAITALMMHKAPVCSLSFKGMSTGAETGQVALAASQTLGPYRSGARPLLNNSRLDSSHTWRAAAGLVRVH